MLPAAAGYDRSITVFSPDGRLYQVEYAIETVRRGTLALGIKCKDGVLLAVEEKTRKLQISDVTQKIFQIDDHIGVAAAGYIPDARAQVDHARFFAQSNKLIYDEPVDVEIVAKNIADKNGPKLAQFILDLKSKCRDTDIRIIAHSLGGEVVNSTLASLSSNQQWDKKGVNITSVHLLGAAIDRSSVAANSTFGKAIERLVGGFYNLRNSEDNMLQYVYQNID